MMKDYNKEERKPEVIQEETVIKNENKVEEAKTEEVKDEEQQEEAEELDTTGSKKWIILFASIAVVIIAVLVMIVVTISSKPKEVQQEPEPTVQVQVVEEVEPVEVKEEPKPQPEPEPEPVVEPEPEVEEEVVEEPTPQVVYEGIDMESTLPGAEWIATFVGVIDEPKLVVYNDSNNKKMILEDFQEVKFVEGDEFAIYLPDGMESISYFNYSPFAEIIYEDKAIIMKTLIPEYVADGSIMLESVIKFKDGVYYTLTCTLVFTE